MNANDIVRRMKAWEKGRPLPRGATLHLAPSESSDILITAFVRMGGESSPWGIAFGNPGKKPDILTVPEPRDRNLVADMVAAVAPVFLGHFRHPKFDDESPADGQGLESLRQIWLPNASHVDMVHFLNYTYTFTKWGEKERAAMLNAMGRLCGWLFRESRRPGQMTVMLGTEALRSCYTFPSEDIRQAHLGYLLAWLETPGKRAARLQAAHAAEQLSVATSLDPTIERDELEPLLAHWADARSNANDRGMSRDAAAMHTVLSAELTRRYELVNQAIRHLKKDPRRVNQGVEDLNKASNEELWFQYLRNERKFSDDEDGPAFVASPETDRHPAAASSRYFVHEASEELRVAALIHDDAELQDEAIAEGEAIRGVIQEVWDEGEGRSTVPVWTIEAPDLAPLRIREGSWLCVAGLPNRTLIVRRIDPGKRGKLIIEVEVTGLKRGPRAGGNHVLPAASPEHKDKEVTLVPHSTEGMLRRKSQKIWAKDTPGSWLTNARPAGPRSTLPEEAAEDLDSLYVEPE